MRVKLVSLILLLMTLLFAAAANAQSYNRQVRIVNNTSTTLVYFYASNVDRTTWEEDILGSSVVPSGSSVMINIDDGSGYCRYDFRAVFSDGSEMIRAGVNVCEVATYTYSD